MCNLSKGVMEKGMAKGMEKGMAKGMEKGMAKGVIETTLTSIKNLKETLGLTIEQAMSALKVPEVDRQKYMDLLKQQE